MKSSPFDGSRAAAQASVDPVSAVETRADITSPAIRHDAKSLESFMNEFRVLSQPEIVVHGRIGWRVTGGDRQELVQALSYSSPTRTSAAAFNVSLSAVHSPFAADRSISDIESFIAAFAFLSGCRHAQPRKLEVKLSAD